MSREEGWEGAVAAVSLFPKLAGSCWENPGNPVSPARRASCPVQGRCVRWMGGQGTTLSPPLWHLWGQGAAFCQVPVVADCARCPLGFRGAVRRPGSGALAVTVKAGLHVSGAPGLGATQAVASGCLLLVLCPGRTRDGGGQGGPRGTHSPSSRWHTLDLRLLWSCCEPSRSRGLFIPGLHPSLDLPRPLAPVGSGGPLGAPRAWGASELTEGPAAGKEGGGWVN